MDKIYPISNRKIKKFSSYFKDKVVIVTGASSGIGLASAQLFSFLGSKVVYAARSVDKIHTYTKDLPEDSTLVCKCDVTIREDCQSLIDATIQKFGKIDILVNNAGVSMRAMFKDLDLSVIESLMNVNFWGTVYCTKFALPYLLESKGSVVGVISIAGYSALPARCGYSASKFAVRGFLDTLRIEHLKDDLNVLVFAPGYTESNVRNAALNSSGKAQGETPLKEDKLMSSQECAYHLINSLYKRKSNVSLTLLGKSTIWLHRLFPRLTDKLTYSYIAKEQGSPYK